MQASIQTNKIAEQKHAHAIHIDRELSTSLKYWLSQKLKVRETRETLKVEKAFNFVALTPRPNLRMRFGGYI